MIRRSSLLLAAFVALAPSALPQTISNLSPNTAVAGSGPIFMTINGQFAQAQPTVYWFSNFSEVTTTLNVNTFTGSQVVVTIPASLLTMPDTAFVYLTQGSAVSNQVNFTVTQAPPTLTSLQPSFTIAGSPTFNLTVNGSNIQPYAGEFPIAVTWNGTPLTTNYISTNQVSATVPASLVAQAGTAQVSLNSQPAPQPLTFTIAAPLTLTSINPGSTTAGGPAFTLTANGSGFTKTTQVIWSGTTLNTSFVSASQVTASVPAILIATAGTAQVSVTDPSSRQTSQSLPFVTNSQLTLTSLSPSSVTAGSPTFTLTVNGSGFDANTAIYWNGAALPTTSQNASQMMVTVASALIAQPGSATVNAKNSSQTSNTLNFTIAQQALTLTSISPNSATAGGPAFTLTANGSGFGNGTQITWNGSPLSTTFVNATQLTAQVSAALIATAGTASVGVASPGQPSPSPLTFTITQGLTLTSLSPQSAVAGGPAFTLTVNGTGFTANTLVTWNGSTLATSFVTATQLTAAVPANLIANPGTASVNVSAPNQTAPAALPFAINQTITLTSLSPPSIAPGGPAFTLTVTGTGFTSGTVVAWNGQVLPTTVSSSTTMTASVPATLIAQAGTASITAQNGTGTVISNVLSFTIAGQPLTLTSLSPGSAPAGSSSLTLIVNGSGFLAASPSGTVPTPGTTVTWNGSPLATQFISSNQLSATVPAALLTNPGTVPVSVTGSPAPASLTFTITSALTITSISPTGAAVGGPGFTLTVNGTGFTNSTTVTWNGSLLPTTFVSSTQLTAAVPASLIASPGTAAVSVSAANQPAPPAIQFNITQGLTLTSLSPASTTAGGSAFTLTVNGTGFTSGTTVNWNSTALTTTFVSATQLTAAVPAGLIAQPGTASITASTASQLSNALTFTIAPPIPVITSISPSSVSAAGPGFTLTVTGMGFVNGATVSFNASGLTTTFVTPTQLTAAIPANLIAQPGMAQITVSNPAGGPSNAVTLTIVPAGPVITNISPSSVSAGGPAFTLTVTGTGFASGAVVSFNGATLVTTFVSGTQVTAAVPASLIVQQGSAQITVSNPTGPASNAATLTIAAPAPVITSISPTGAAVGGPAFTLTVNGTGFVPGAVVSFNSTALTTSFVSATQVTAGVPASLIATPGTAQITLSNPGGAMSNAVTLTVQAPVPTITSISPATVIAGGPTFTLTVTGTNFLPGATVTLSTTTSTGSTPTFIARIGTSIRTPRHESPADSTGLTTTYVSDTQLTAQVPAILIAQAGTAQITATNTGGATSNAVTLTIGNPTPILTNISPSSVTIGGGAFTLTVSGSNFVQGATVQVATSTLATTFVSNTQLTAAVPANLLQTAGQVLVTVTNPGTMPSNPLNLTVTAPVPTINIITPDMVRAGGPAFTLTVNGTGFLTGATVFFNSSALSTTVASPTQITAQVPANLIAQPGAAQITVSNQGGAPSIAVTLTIVPASPVLSSISPTSARVGDPTFNLSLTGTGFVPASVVQWNGAPLSTTYVSSILLTATVDAGRLILPGSASVTVVNPGPNGTPQVSNALTFTINPVTPAISSISPNSATAGDAALTLTVNGSGFLTLTTIQWNTTMLTTHFVNAGQVTADVPATLLAQAGAATVVAVNPGNQVSGSVTFTINPRPAPVISSLSKTSATAGDAAFTLTVNGTGFTSGAAVSFGTTALGTTFVSATQLTAAVPASLLLTPNTTYQVTVQEAGLTSNPVSFTVNLPAAPSLRLNPPTNTGPAQQPTIDFGLNSGYPLPLSGTVTLTFAPNATVPSDDPAIQFASGGRTMNFTVPANSTTLPPLQISTGTVAGTITVSVTLMAGGVNVTPAGSSITIPVPKTAPVILPGKVTLVRANGYLEVDVTGYSTTRDMTQVVFKLNAAPGGSFIAPVITLPVSSPFTSWYTNGASTSFGSQFTYSQPFSVIGDINQVQSVTVTLTNSAGASVSVTSN